MLRKIRLKTEPETYLCDVVERPYSDNLLGHPRDLSRWYGSTSLSRSSDHFWNRCHLDLLWARYTILTLAGLISCQNNHDSTDCSSSFVNCYAFLWNIMKSYFLDLLPPKARENSLPCYLSRSLDEELMDSWLSQGHLYHIEYNSSEFELDTRRCAWPLTCQCNINIYLKSIEEWLCWEWFKEYHMFNDIVGKISDNKFCSCLNSFSLWSSS